MCIYVYNIRVRMRTYTHNINARVGIYAINPQKYVYTYSLKRICTEASLLAFCQYGNTYRHTYTNYSHNVEIHDACPPAAAMCSAVSLFCARSGALMSAPLAIAAAMASWSPRVQADQKFV